ncbi:hypothetical protein HHI36_016927 [Cryptolaemus montrouzieri]|uniref:Uncharacterized protein n=1 Tax=Cryptolaemus montrouzieri TaxID=559131 RepID=A0ABD2NM42_9CUCU
MKMDIVGCKCLNIIIETGVSEFPVVEKSHLELTIEENEDNFFKNENLRQVENLDNIMRNLPGLVETREVGSWIIHYCINCKVHTHAVHKEKGASCVLVNSNLLASDIIKKLKNSDNFSKAFGILIDTSQYDENEDTFYPSEVEPVLKGIKQTSTENMRKETALVEERIKQFTEDQYTILDNLREKLFNEEHALIRTVLHHISTKSKNNAEELNKPDVDTQSSPQCEKNSEESLNQAMASNQMMKHTPKRQKSTPVQNNYDSDFLFDFDGIEERSLENEEEVESDNDYVTPNLKNSSKCNPRTRTSSIKIAKSLPMDIPVFMRLKKEDEADQDDEDLQSIDDNVDIAASIKKLAKSVHGSGIFGELPRPRFSTQL